MEFVFGLLVTTLAVSHGLETQCDGRQDGAQCFGPLGGSVHLQLVDSFSQITLYSWFKNTTRIFRGMENNISFNKLRDRSSFTPSTGLFRLNDLRRTDSDEYRLEIFNLGGIKLEEKTLHLTVQAPVPDVHLTTDCLSQGKTNASCITEGGDSLQFSWTLDGKTLTDDQIFSRNKESDTITVRAEGDLVCTVSNNVSKVSDDEKIHTCGFKLFECTLINGTDISEWLPDDNNTQCITPTTPSTSTEEQIPVVAGVLSALVFLLVLGVAVVCSQRQKQNNKLKEDDEEEITYADVKVLQRQGRAPQQTQEMVEYGEVKISGRGRSRQTVDPIPAADECVYSQVRKAR